MGRPKLEQQGVLGIPARWWQYQEQRKYAVDSEVYDGMLDEG